MEESAAVREALLTFYQRFSAGNVDAFAQSIAAWPDAFVIGTGPTDLMSIPTPAEAPAAWFQMLLAHSG